MAPFSLPWLTNFISILSPSTQLPNSQPKSLPLLKTSSQCAPPQLLANSTRTLPSTFLSYASNKADDVTAVVSPSLAYANTLFFKSSVYNVEVHVGENETEEELLKRFRRAVYRAGVFFEIRRRRFFENPREKKKRKAKEAARKYGKRRWISKPAAEAQPEEPKKDDYYNSDDDNWEYSEESLPY